MNIRRSGLTAVAIVSAALLCPAASAQPTAEAPAFATARISLRGSDLPLANVLSQVARSAGLVLVFEKDVKADGSVSPSFDNTPLPTALTVLLTPLGYSFSVDPRMQTLRISGMESRTFRINVPVVTSAWETAITNEGGQAAATGGAAAGSSGSGGLGARIALASRSDSQGLWSELEHSLKSIIGDAPGSAFTINRVAGFATVRTSTPVMAAVASYFEALNAEMSRTVVIETRVMQIDFNDSTQAGVDWRAVDRALGATGVTLAGTGATTSLPGSAAVIHVSGKVGDVFIRALEEQGKLNLVAQPSLVLGNNLPAIIEVGRVQSYVTQQTQTVAAQGLSQTTVETGTVSDGLTLSILPRLSETGEVTLAMATVVQDILQIRRESFGDGFVELPETSRRAYSGVVRAKMGESLIVGGLISDRKEDSSLGLPLLARIPIVGILFGQQKYVTRRSELIITITPKTAIAGPAAPVTPE